MVKHILLTFTGLTVAFAAVARVSHGYRHSHSESNQREQNHPKDLQKIHQVHFYDYHGTHQHIPENNHISKSVETYFPIQIESHNQTHLDEQSIQPASWSVCEYRRPIVQYQQVQPYYGLPEESGGHLHEQLVIWEEKAKKFKLSTKDESVLVLGNTGSGKSTLVSLLTDADVESVHDIETDEYRFLDKADRIGNGSVITSKTEIPELLIDNETKIAYYDCPGFSDTRGPENDISVTYFIQKLLTFTKSVKFVFTVSSSSVKSTGDRKDFVKLAKYAINLIENIEKYRNAIALVVTKIPNEIDGNGVIIKDETYIKRTVRFIINAKEELMRRNNDTNTPADVRQSNDKIIKFMNILLHQSGGQYDRIGLLRLANKAGKLNDLPSLENEIIGIREIVRGSIEYAAKDDRDFGYSISAESINYAHNLIAELNNRFLVNVKNISNDIVQFYLEQESFLFNLKDIDGLREKLSLGRKLLSQINSTQLQLFKKQIENIVKILNVQSAIGHFNNFSRNVEFLEFLTTLTKQNWTVSTELINAASNVKFIDEMEHWYIFLDNLSDEFNKYQYETLKLDDLSKVIGQFAVENQMKPIKELELNKLFDSINSWIYPRVQESMVNLYKLKALDAVLRNVIYFEKSCSPDKLVVTAYNAKVSDLMKIDCWSTNLTSIDIFVLNKFFVDANIDRTGMKVTQLTIIAPTWHIIGQSDMRKIILNGANGEPHSDLQAQGVEKEGQAGLPGTSAGHFVGIGANFINGEHLEVYANGGKGGPGQQGGKGKNGVTGEDAPFPPLIVRDECEYSKYERSKKQQGFRFEIYETLESKWILPNDIRVRVYGKNGTSPHNGANGGKGGLGGNPGHVITIGLNQDVTFKISNVTGEEGEKGKGGPGGNGTNFGSNIKIERRTKSLAHPLIGYKELCRDLGTETGAAISAANAGIDGGSENKPKDPKINPFSDPSYTINSYKSFVRQFVSGDVLDSQSKKFKQFIELMDKNDQMRSIYSAISLIDEFECMEKQYYELRNKIAFEPYIESLLDRLQQYSDQIQLNDEKKIAMSFLYTAAMSKLTGIRDHIANISTVNLLGYMKTIENHITELSQAEQEIKFHKNFEGYYQTIKNKIDSANKLIENDVTQEIDRILGDTEINIENLVEETVARENRTKEEIDESLANERALESSIRLRRLMIPLKVASGALQFCGPAGMAAGAALSMAAQICDAAVDGKIVDNLSPSLKIALGNIQTEMKRQSELLKLQINDIEVLTNEYTKEDPTFDVKDIQSEITRIKNQIDSDKKFNVLTDPTIIVRRRVNRGKLKELLDKKKKSLEQKKPENENKFSKQTRYLEHASKIIACADIGLNIYKTYRNDETKLEQLRNATNALRSQLDELNKYEEDIYNVIFPKVRKMQDDVNNVITSLAQKSSAELDVRKWKIKSWLTDLRKRFRKLTETFKAGDQLLESIDKLDDAITVMIDVYERIDALTDDIELGSYIAKIASSNTDFVDENLQNAVAKLKRIINTNNILEQNEVLMHAFQQHKFPFAKIYMSDFALPPSLQIDNVTMMAKHVSNQVRTLKERIKHADCTLGKYERDVHPNIDFNDANLAPFFTWKYDQIKDKLRQLLRGEHITLNADISKGVDLNAIKFKKLELRFNLKNAKSKAGMQEALNDFGVRLTLIGNNYYRCNDRVYYLTTDGNVVYDHTIKKNQYGEPYYNEIADKIASNDYFLSPYGIWGVQLQSGNFEALSQYEDEAVDLELIGVGQYFDPKSSFTAEICNKHLDQFYNFYSYVRN